MKQPITLSGHVYDALGNPVANQAVSIQGGSINVSATTDSTGNYSLQSSSGTYQFAITNSNNLNNNFSQSISQSYNLFANNYTIIQNTSLDVTLPFKKVDVHVQNALNNPVSGITITASSPNGFANNNGLSIGGNITNASGQSEYNSGPTTDSLGNTTLWLFSNNENRTYTFTATPSSDSTYKTFNLSNITVSGDQTELISLQYNHATPVTTATLSPDADGQGNYPDPTTLTLSATAASGYTVANTYYTIDGGSQEAYSSPFTISGDGSHTITYWSVDNSGVQEAHNNKSFTIVEPTPTPTNTPTPTPTNTPTPTPIPTYSLTGVVYVDANQNGVQDAGEVGYGGAAVTLDNNQTTTTDNNGNYSISNLQTGVYVETLTLPDGYLATTSNPVTLSLSADTTQNFGISPLPTPTPTQEPTPTPTETPTPTPPQVTALNPAGIWVGLTNSDDIGIKFDLLADVYRDGVLISSGQLDSVAGGNSGFNNAHLYAIPFNAFQPADFPQGSQLTLTLSVRNACAGSGKNSGRARLWYNDTQANTHFGTTIGQNTTDYFLRDNFLLSTIPGQGPKKTIDIQSGAKCSPFKPFGTWNITP